MNLGWKIHVVNDTEQPTQNVTTDAPTDSTMGTEAPTNGTTDATDGTMGTEAPTNATTDATDSTMGTEAPTNGTTDGTTDTTDNSGGTTEDSTPGSGAKVLPSVAMGIAFTVMTIVFTSAAM